MSTSPKQATSNKLVGVRHFRAPQTVIGRFTARRTARSAALWALVFAIFVASKSVGFATAYPTAAARAKLANSFGSNVGLSALFGVPHDINSVVGFTTWNTLAGMMIIGSVWALLTATRIFRGEEDSGRWELLLSGQTTARRAAANALVGLGASLLILYIVAAAAFVGIGKIHSVDFSPGAALFFGLAGVSGAAMFMAVGALASQLMPTRSRAASLSAVVFGVSFLLRAMADTTNAHWLLNFTPLGWIEKLQPLYAPQPLWLVPIGLFIAILAGATIWLAGRRDLGDSTFADKDSAPAHLFLLHSPLGLGVRLTRMATIGWLVGITLGATFFGLLTKSAAQAFSGSSRIHNVFSHLTHAAQITGATTFLGVIFLLLMMLIMAFTASSLGHVRDDEAEGYLDNLLVQPISRLRWLSGRVLLIIIAIVLAGLAISGATWATAASQHIGLSFHTLLLAGLNAMVPALVVLGFGIFALGFAPRITTLVAYGVLAWSFLLQLVSSGVNLNHWILDSSVFSHLSLAPAVNPDWRADLALLLTGFILLILGSLRFNSRDLEAE